MLLFKQRNETMGVITRSDENLNVDNFLTGFIGSR